MVHCERAAGRYPRRVSHGLNRRYRYAVLGCGGIGSATAYWLSRRAGADVVALEQYPLGHSHGASEDHSRIIRHSYHHANYTALTGDAFEAWRTVERESGLGLVHATGGIDLALAGSPGEAELEANQAAMDAYGIPYERLDRDAIGRRWPQFSLPGEAIGVYQHGTGILDIRRGTAAHVALARARGATVVGDTPVRGVSSSADGVTLETEQGDIEADTLMVCAGAWTPDVLRSLGVDLPIVLSEEQVTYFATPNVRAFAPDRFPVWIWHGEPLYYGFPVYGEVATKASEERLLPLGALADRSGPDPERVERLRAFLDELIPGYTGAELYSRACVYDMPPDRDFLIGPLPGHPRVIACVGAGHAAKFAGLLGRILADLAVDGRTRFPIEPFSPDRPALTDPTYGTRLRLAPVAV